MKTIEILEAIESAQSLEDLQNLFFSIQDAHEAEELEVDDFDWMFISQSVQIKANQLLPPDQRVAITLQ